MGKGFGKAKRPNIAKIFAESVNYHQKRQFDKALQGYEEVLNYEPTHLDALSNLGSLYKSLGKYPESISYYRQALDLNPDRAETWFNYGNALQAHRNLEEAAVAFIKAIEIKPDLGVAYFNLGRVRQEQERLIEAEDHYKKAISLVPNLVRAHTNLGNVLKSLGKIEEAIASHKKALEIETNYPDGYYNLGNAFREKKDYEQAIISYRQAIQQKMDFVEAWLNLAGVLQTKGERQQAEEVLKQAIVHNPLLLPGYLSLSKLAQERGDWPASEIYIRQGLAVKPYEQSLIEALLGTLQAQNKLEEGIIYIKEQITKQPDLAICHYYLGLVYNELGRFQEAVPSLKEAVRLKPDLALANASLAYSLIVIGKLSEAITYCQKAKDINPKLAISYLNMGFALNNQGRIAEAIKCFQECLRVEPDYYPAQANFLYAMNYDEIYTPKKIAEAHFSWGEGEEAKYTNLAKKVGKSKSAKRKKKKILKIGYLSPDFRQHSVAFFIQPILAHHKSEEFELFCYANVAAPDAVTDRLRYLAQHWYDISYMNDDQVVERIKEDGIDILVDLAGHTGKSRLPIFARKVAPIQFTYLGYPNTTGLKSIEYRLTDAWADPPGMTDAYYTESLIRLPRCFLCYNPPTVSPAVNSLPAHTMNKITFGSFNNVAKLTKEVIDIWSKILNAVPNSRIILKSHGFEDDLTQNRYLEMFAENGIKNHRVKLVGAIPDANYHLAFYGNIDICLDPFPYNGTTTTCEALWMGIPVITLAGTVHAARVGVSLLNTIGLPNLIGEDLEDYIAKAVYLAENLDYLNELRSTLRKKVADSPLCDGVELTREIEKVYQQVWLGLI